VESTADEKEALLFVENVCNGSSDNVPDTVAP